MQKQILNFQAKALQDRTFRAVASTESQDRDGEVILAGAWQNGLDEYRRNPIVLFAHDNKQLPVAKTTAISVQDKSLVMEGQFPAAGISRLSDEVYSLLKGGFLTSLSVGFLGKKYQYIGNIKTWQEVQLLEISLVPVPANAEARVLQVKHLGEPADPRNMVLGDPNPDINIEDIDVMDLRAALGLGEIDLESIEMPVIEVDGRMISESELKQIVNEVIAENLKK